MSIARHLQKVRDVFPGCHVLAYADLSTNTVLAVSSDTELMQEHYNALCERAVRVLNGPATTSLMTALDGTDAPIARHAIVCAADELTIFIKSESNGADAFCCQCDPEIALQAFLDCANEKLSLIGAGG